MATEFDLLADNAEELGLDDFRAPLVARVGTDVEGSTVSAIRWGADPARVVLIHGGGQNAHTWDSVLVALGEPALAIDLPGHGHSNWRDDGDYRPHTIVDAVAAAIAEHASDAELIVGMSLGGLTAIALAQRYPDLVPNLVLVDVSPQSSLRYRALSDVDKGTVALVSGPSTFDDLDVVIEATASAAPNRSRSSIRRGVIHNTRQTDDGRWRWRYDAMRVDMDPEPLWEALSSSDTPITLVRGGASQFVADADVAELIRRRPRIAVTTVPGSGHSVQSDAPLVLASVIGSLLNADQGRL